MIKKLNPKKQGEAILKVQLPAYEIEATLIQSRRIPALHDTVESIQLCDETFYGFYREDVLVGFISYKRKHTVLDIHRLVVHPAFFRQGIASKLLECAERKETSLTKMIVSTGSANEPALAFYCRHGFMESGKIQVDEGLYLTQFEKHFFA